jgi:hypothetical protein
MQHSSIMLILIVSVVYTATLPAMALLHMHMLWTSAEHDKSYSNTVHDAGTGGCQYEAASIVG